MAGTAFLCGPPAACTCKRNPAAFDQHECWCCGGWMHSNSPETGEPEVPVGELGICGRYCSIDCHDEAIEAGWHDDCDAL